MIRLISAPEPPSFHSKARQPGNDWLSRNTDATKRIPDRWSAFREDLRSSQSGLCAYAAMIVWPEGEVDHYFSTSNHRHLAYEWSNYRYSSGLLNKLKDNLDDAVLDPYAIGNGWFEILLPSLQLVCTDAVPTSLRVKADETIRLLKLRDDERVLRWRRGIFEQYQLGKITLEGLREWAPLIAAAVDKSSLISPVASGDLE